MWTPKTAFLQSWFTCRCNQPSQAFLPIRQNPCLKPCQWPRNQVLGNLESILSSSMVYHRHVSRSILLYIDTSAFSTHTYILLAMVSNQLTFSTISTYSQSSLGQHSTHYTSQTSQSVQGYEIPSWLGLVARNYSEASQRTHFEYI